MEGGKLGSENMEHTHTGRKDIKNRNRKAKIEIEISNC